MARLVETARVAEKPDILWKDIGPFGAVGQWHPFLSKVDSEGERPGALRSAEGKDGSRQVERLLEANPMQHRYRYRMEKTAMPLRGYTAELRIEDNLDGTSTVVWSAEFAPTSDDTETIDRVRAFLKAGLDNIATRYGAQLANRPTNTS